MRLPRPVRRFYYAHERLTKASGVFAFLVVVALLYVLVFRSPAVTSIAGTLTPTPTGSASPVDTTTATTAPKTPGVVPTPAPPFPLGQYQVTTRSNVPYGPVENLTERLDLCIPVGAGNFRPGLILLHSGGFIQGDKQDFDPFCKAFASYGFVVATPNYRLAPKNLWPAPLVDAQLVVRWLRANASDNHLNPQRLCALGADAGANLALFLGELATNHAGDKTTLYSDESPQVSCVVDEFAPTDMSKLTTTIAWKDVFPALFGQTNQHSPILMRDASPLYWVTAQAAPTMIIQGTIDQVVPPSQSTTMQSKLQASGVHVSYVSYKGGDHFGNLNQSQYNAIQLQIVTFLENYA
jgi:acetyl esterase/lipase